MKAVPEIGENAVRKAVKKEFCFNKENAAEYEKTKK